MKKQITAMLSSLLVLPGLVLVLFSHLTAALPTDSIRVTTPCNDTVSLSAGHIGLPNELGAVLEKSKAKAIRLSDRNIDRMGLKQAAAIAQAARCPSVNQKKWQCGEACTSLPDIKLFWTYGDNREIPYIMVAYSSAMQAVIVAHAGSNFKSLESWLIDFDFNKDKVSAELYRGGGKRPEVHGGFHDLWMRTNKRILEQVNRALDLTKYTKVLCIGHSLGGAVAQMDAVFLRNKLPKRIRVQYVGFGVPRVGDSRWASVVESKLGNSQVHVTNDDDIVPHTPPEFIGFTQTRNEIWIDRGKDEVILCRNRENEDCAAGVRTTSLTWTGHGGPYFGVDMESDLCQ